MKNTVQKQTKTPGFRFFMDLSLKFVAGYTGTYPELMLFASVRSNRYRSAALTVERTSEVWEEGSAKYTTREWAVPLSDLDSIAADLCEIGTRPLARPLPGEPDCSWWANVILEAALDDLAVRIETGGHGFEGEDRIKVQAVFRKIAALLDIQSDFIRAVLASE